MYLAISTNALAALLSAPHPFSYLFLYTPLNTISPLCTLVARVPGRGNRHVDRWAAARGHLDPAAWVICRNLSSSWQFPHFMSIAWMYREDYARAGYLVLPASESETALIVFQCLLPALSFS